MDNFWNIQLTTEEKAGLIPASFDDKDLLTDFEYLNRGKYLEHSVSKSEKRQIFFDSYGNVWQTTYFRSQNHCVIKCLSIADKETFDEAWVDMMQMNEVDYEDSNLVQHIMHDKDKGVIMVDYYHSDEL